MSIYGINQYKYSFFPKIQVVQPVVKYISEYFLLMYNQLVEQLFMKE